MIEHHKFRVLSCACLSSTATPHPGGFKCFTCQDAADNYECNRWAPDVYCPKGTAAFCSFASMCVAGLIEHKRGKGSYLKQCFSITLFI